MTRHTDCANNRVRALVSGSQTAGRLALLELREPAGCEPPRHLHSQEDEIVYVLEGRLTFYVGEETCEAVAGTCVVLPRGVDHGYVVQSGTARLLVALAPAGMEGYFGDDVDGHGCADMERLIAGAARYGVTITGPPPTAGDCTQ